MDSQDRDEIKIRRREEALARRVGEALDQMKPGGAAECPGAEIIAAYAEQALGPAESAHWDGHFATCARCRNILRVLAASADTPLAEKEVAQLGQLISTARAPVEISRGTAGSARPKIIGWRTRWLAPAIGVAAVLAVWFAMRPPWRTIDRGASPTLIAQAPRQETPLNPAPAEADRFSKVAPAENLKKEAAPPPDRSVAQTAPRNSPMNSPVNGRPDSGAALDSVSRGNGGDTRALQKQKKLSAPPEEREVQPSASPSVPPPSPKAQIAMRAPAAPQSEAKSSSNNALAESAPAIANGNAIENAPTRDKQAPTPQAATGAIVSPEVSSRMDAGARKRQSAVDLKTTEQATIEATAPFGSTVWRMGKGGSIERSADAGETWVRQSSPSLEDWLAGVAVSDTVCWVAGRNGSIARTADGESWERVAPPVQVVANGARLPDWTGVTARDAQSATITASDGRKFSTADGGKTWQKQ
jgi:hypothetical protein